jgi:GMP synthase-like glutamine amidotransferase
LRVNGAKVTHNCIFEDAGFPDQTELDGLIVLGGPMSVNDVDLYPWLKQEIQFIANTIANGKPVLGICLGAQLTAKAMGASVYKSEHKEIGWFPVERVVLSRQNQMETLLPERAEVFQWHGETFDLPVGATRLATSKACANQAFLFANHVIGLQFHLEITREGAEMLIRHCQSELVPGNYVQRTNELLRDEFHFQRSHSLINPTLQHLFLN